jgi:membrane protease YdiL (CAAX protease family)
VRLGLAAFCVATPLILGLYLLAQTMTNHLPHQFEELAREDLHTFEWVFLAFSAIVLPPLLEEWLFRGLLQGWLRRAAPLGHFLVAGVALFQGCWPFAKSILDWLNHRSAVETLQIGAPAALVAMDLEPPSILWESLVFALLIVAGYIAGVLRLWWPVFQIGLRHFNDQPSAADIVVTVRLDQLEGQTPVLLPSGPRWEEFKRANAHWAVVGSAVLFALMHEAWPSAVALLPLGLLLGWLAYRTQSLIPGIVLHALFNTVAYFVLLLDKS